MGDLADASLAVLDELQRRESKLLAWGMVDGAFTDEELTDIAAGVIDQHTFAVEADDALEWLEDCKLLVEVREPEGRYRTRVAEGVRLFARLRQIFPDQNWQQSAHLVADFRFMTLPRRYPDRNLGVTEALDSLGANEGCGDLHKEVGLALLGGEDTDWKLADFQLDATRRVLTETRESRSTATIVCAGTGSGKTLAFYLPAFMRVAGDMGTAANTQCLAIYPRIELLRDQLKTAIENARRVEPAIRRARGRPLSIGVLYGAVPNRAEDLDQQWHLKQWPRIHRGESPARRCPYLDCPDCAAPLAWLDEDRAGRIERLLCVRCDLALGGDQLRLTRQSMGKRPPDILFSTTEMLNRGLSNHALWPLFGIGEGIRPPTMVLLDEVHTYGGVSGAQVSLVLRRWRHLAAARPHFVGLSATLAQAPRFMAQLVGLYPNQVAAIEPKALVTEGCEYIIALRAKPGTATLSSTIQASMLLRRLLDTDSAESGGVSGERIFVFTDNLDVTNRLYFQLGDAEGWYRPHRPRRPAPHPPLASYRSRTLPNAAARYREGQSWDVAEDIGHDLSANGRAIVGRTSSQDSGVASDADIVVATASLEVGFDDPKVGGVIQHGAPRDPAAYVQRKGRAGRSRIMRPWTVVVLSDWGKDRHAYRAYEDLFSPTVPARHLPVKNRHVLRMQAALSFLDWLAKRTRKANLWRDLSKTGKGPTRQRQLEIAATLEKLLSDSHMRERFVRHLEHSLGLEAGEAAALMWEAPRSLVFSVWPTLLRRLEQQWLRLDGTSEAQSGHPMPEFIPRALFDDLNLPEVAIRLERHGGRQTDRPADDKWMPIRQALSEFTPGRVSRRFGIDHALDSHWVPPPEAFVGPLSIETFCSHDDREPLGTFQYVEDEEVKSIEVVRPHRILTAAPERDIDPRSDGRPVWHSQIVANGPGMSVSLPRNSVWRDFLLDVRFHTHVDGSPIELRRFTTGANIRVKRGPQRTLHEGLVSYETTRGDKTTPVALGFAVDVDAIAVTLRIPGKLCALVENRPELLRSVRVAMFRSAVKTAGELDGVANVFEREAMAEAYLAALVVVAERDVLTLEAARERLRSGGSNSLIEQVLDTLRPADRDAHGAQAGIDDDATTSDLGELLENQSVRTVLYDAADVLHRQFGADDNLWLREALKATVGGALLGACQRLCPQVDAGDLLVELSPGPSDDGELHTDQVWLTEAMVGGSGFIEAIQRAFAEDPRSFMHMMEAELEPSDFEDVDHYLRVVLEDLASDGPTQTAALRTQFEALRGAEGFTQQTAHFEAILAELRVHGVPTTHAVVSALALRMLRPGTSAQSDAFLKTLLDARDAVESRLGIELDSRSYGVLVADDAQTGARIAVAFSQVGQLSDRGAIHALVTGQLWPRGAEIRHRSLAFWNPFENAAVSDRLLLHAVVPHAPATVSAELENWREQLDEVLRAHGRAGLVAPVSKPDLLRRAALELASVPTESGSMLVYPRVRACHRALGYCTLIFDMPEALQ